MKNTIILALCLIVFLFSACKTEPDSKAVKKEVLNLHDKLMIDGGKVMSNKMKLDSILKSSKLKSPEEAVKIRTLISSLSQADESMMDWMHLFNDDFKGKNEQEDLDYYKSEMVKVRQVEDDYIKVTRASDSVLKEYNVATVAKMNMEHHKH
ncbi:hypothetical protein EV200_106160 [Pedobacter psychrotolerans]|uniref:Viral A-type inclusion protein n=1 Tax=Pedobacter psychrotolerans TaxID=1843235 RepID=A0A4R2H8D2_9SPHI|nr:hypothetical protein [Pedobacter psychrotolerans]TCO22519.1 hypothetical protein EV200_106160 [Pedobacter psychrotolerans]GGE65181.1 hypothetical protein GCM10011413_34540 [Pedobacter psychrotolerans]